jgi:hypothetical protein
MSQSSFASANPALLLGTYASETGLSMHTRAYKMFWQPSPDAEPVRVYSEIFDSDAMANMEDELQDIPLRVTPERNCERVVVPLMLASDATHLASFGTASLWPIYLQFGSQSKYARGRPTSQACHHLCYAPSVSHALSISPSRLTRLSSFPTTLKTGTRRTMAKRHPTLSSRTASASSCRLYG